MKGKKTLGITTSNSLEIEKGTNPQIARIILAKKWSGGEHEVTNVLDTVYKNWSSKYNDTHVEFIITTGGFVEFEWDNSITKNDIGDPLNPNPKIVQRLTIQAQTHLEKILSRNDYVKKFSKFSRYMTFGVDSFSSKLPKEMSRKPHIELIFVVDLKTNEYYHTGKIYPTLEQEIGLVRYTDMESHFLKLDGKLIMILGCHDLTMFNNRAKATAKGLRKEILESFREITQTKKPDIILQHPHSAIKASSWRNGWLELQQELVDHDFWYASAGKYYEDDKLSESKENVFKISKNVDSLDFIFSLS
jgi:hypothetical protein